MNWLLQLLSIDAPANAALQSAEVSLRGPIPWWLGVLIAGAAGAGVFFLYFLERPHQSSLRRALMALLRTALIMLLILLLMRPVLVAEYSGARQRGVALVIDNSQSMKQRDQRLSPPDLLRVAIAENLVAPDISIQDSPALENVAEKLPPNPDRVQLVRAVLSNPRLQLIQGLQAHGPLHGYLFGQRLQSLRNLSMAKGGESTGVEEWLTALKADEPRTALADAINDLLLRKEGDLPAAIVLMTDGRDNASRSSLEEAARECARLKIPLHIYGTGSPEAGLLQIKDIGTPDTLFFEDTVSVPIRWRSQGLKEGQVELTLTLGGKVVAHREVPLREEEEVREVLTFVPEKGGETDENVDLAATIKFKGNPAFQDELKKPVRVIDRRVKILYLENTPRWEFKFLQPALLRDRRVEATFLLVDGDPRVLQSGRPFLAAFPARDQLFLYDLLILGDVPAQYLTPERLEWIRDFVKEGGGLVLIAGRHHAPAGYVDTPLAEVLPLEVLPQKFPVEYDARPQAFVPVLTEAGKRNDMLALAEGEEENLRVWKELPGIYWHYPVTKLRPGGTALLNHPTAKTGEQPMPVLAAQYYGKGQVLFLAMEETWRWRFNVGDRYFARFWGQVIYQIGLPHLLGNSKRVQLALEHADVLWGRPSSIYARLFDADFHPLIEERVPARLDFLDAKAGEERSQKITLEAVPGQPGEYRVLLPNDLAGRFELKMESPEPATLAYRVVLPPQHEMEPGGMEEDVLREAARISGGQFYREEDLHLLPSRIEPQNATFAHRQEVVLWNPLAMLVFLVLVTAEWVLRKFSNLL
ncbi:MAG TPA: hypothetical protein VGY77_01625 [Gemmataceae bacterium]|jgi:hypothetical protein|nr:hypothetical protein [Gemmataceae bacterium]